MGIDKQLFEDVLSGKLKRTMGNPTQCSRVSLKTL